MSQAILKNHKIKFGTAYVIDKAMLDEVQSPKDWKAHLRNKALDNLGETIGKNKPDMWRERIDNSSRSTQVAATLYIFTPAELKELVAQIRQTAGNVDIDGAIL